MMTPSGKISLFCLLLASAAPGSEAMFGSKATGLMRRTWTSIPEEHLDPYMLDLGANAALVEAAEKPHPGEENRKMSHTGSSADGDLGELTTGSPEHPGMPKYKDELTLEEKARQNERVEAANQDFEDALSATKDSLMHKARDALTDVLNTGKSSPEEQFKQQQQRQQHEGELIKEKEKKAEEGARQMAFSENTERPRGEKQQELDQMLRQAMPVKDLKISLNDHKGMRAAFKMFDTNGDSVITTDDLRSMLNYYGADSGNPELGNRVSEYALQRVLDHVDRDDDGHVVLRDYERYLAFTTDKEKEAAKKELKLEEDAKKSFISNKKKDGKQEAQLLRDEEEKKPDALVALAIDAQGNPTEEKPLDQSDKKPVHLMLYNTVPLRDPENQNKGAALVEQYVYGQTTPQAQHAADFSEEHARALGKNSEGQGYKEPEMVGEGSKWQGWGSKVTTALQSLKRTNPEQLVVLSDSYDVLVNPKKEEGKPEDFEKTFNYLIRNHPGAVVVAGEADCCNAAMNQLGEPGKLIAEDGSRNQRACSSGIDRCTHGAPEGDDAWKSFMEIIAAQRGRDFTRFPYVGSGLIAGRAKDLTKLFEFIQISPSEDDQALLAEAFYRKPDSIVVDYDTRLFGSNRPTLGEKDGCLYDVDEKGELFLRSRVASITRKPFMVHTGGMQRDCYDKLTKLLKYDEHAFKEGDVTLVQGQYGDPHRQLGALLMTLPFQEKPELAAASVAHRLVKLIDDESQ